MSFDLLVRGGLVVDGTGEPGYRADIGIANGTIAAVGRLSESGRQEIDADGLVVSPGFIDAHTHMDAQMLWDPMGTSSSWNGVTTVVMGNCGFTLAPCAEEDADLVLRSFERAEEIPRQAMLSGIKWDWTTFSEYMDALERVPKGINYAVNVGHSALRTWAMGERAFEEEATEDDLRTMAAEVRRALSAGAIGFTTSRESNHKTSDDRPVASRIASWQEVETLASVLKDSRRGIFQLAGLTDRIGIPGIVDHQGGNRDKFMALIVKLGLPAAFGFFLLAGSADWDEAVELLDEANNRGARLVAMYHCRPFCHAFSFGTRLPFDDLPEWRSFRALDLAQQKERLLDPEVRNRLVRSVANSELDLNYDDIFVMESGLPPHRSVMSIAKELGSDPVQVILQLVAETDFERVFLIVRGNRCEADLLRVMAHPMTRMTFSDSGAHVQKIMDACIQTYLLAWWVREKQALPLEKAVRMITRDIADSWGLRDRGLLKVGMKADLNIFDQERIQPRVPRVAHDLPGGSPRLVQQCDGIRATVVNGRVILRDGEATGLLPGSVVRDGGRWTA